jgi:hypothetical protein
MFDLFLLNFAYLSAFGCSVNRIAAKPRTSFAGCYRLRVWSRMTGMLKMLPIVHGVNAHGVSAPGAWL